jgi:hypothetical protein
VQAIDGGGRAERLTTSLFRSPGATSTSWGTTSSWTSGPGRAWARSPATSSLRGRRRWCATTPTPATFTGGPPPPCLPGWLAGRPDQGPRQLSGSQPPGSQLPGSQLPAQGPCRPQVPCCGCGCHHRRCDNELRAYRAGGALRRPHLGLRVNQQGLPLSPAAHTRHASSLANAAASAGGLAAT